MNVLGKIIVFKNEYGYSTTISTKNKNGEYEKMYISLQLPRDREVENKTFINIKNGFLSFYKTNEGLSKIKVVVLDYDIDEEQSEREAIQNEGIYSNSNDDLPF